MLCARLRMLRRENGLSQQDLAHKLGISASAIGMYEQGRREPDYDTLVRMARLFGVSTDYLLTGHAAPFDKATLQRAFARALQEAEADLTLRAEDGTERAFSKEDLATLFSALFG